MSSSSPTLPHLVEIEVANARYLVTLRVLSDTDFRTPSLLPGWTRGHVATHLARHADALYDVVLAAQTGVGSAMYPSLERREADIAAGGARSGRFLYDEAQRSGLRLKRAFRELHPGWWDTPVSRTPGSPTFPVRDLAVVRRTEVEVHHADLGARYSAADWPEDFTDLLIERIQRDRADGPPLLLRATDSSGSWRLGHGDGPEVTGSRADLAWWLLGRGDGAGLVSSAGVLPELGKWR